MLTIGQMIDLLIFILPAYFANSSPVFFRTGKSKTPMDLKLKFYDSRRVLGEGKTWAGFFVGIATGTLIGYLTYALGLIRVYPTLEQHLVVAFLLSLGTMTGDAVGSFVKRRLAMTKGKPFYPMDQLSFLLFALLFVLPYRPEVLGIPGFIFLLIITLIVHTLANVIAYKVGLKKEPY